MVADAIAKYMTEKGIKQVFLCEKCGLSKHSVSLILKNKRKVDVEEYRKICDALEVPYDYFFECGQ